MWVCVIIINFELRLSVTFLLRVHKLILKIVCNLKGQSPRQKLLSSYS